MMGLSPPRLRRKRVQACARAISPYIMATRRLRAGVTTRDGVDVRTGRGWGQLLGAATIPRR